MTPEDLIVYQRLRTSNGLPSISDADAMQEAQSLLNIISLVTPFTYATSK